MRATATYRLSLASVPLLGWGTVQLRRAHVEPVGLTGALTNAASQPGTGISVFVAVAIPLFVSLVGLALDAGHLYAVHADLQAVADAAARAGAAQLDTTGGGALLRHRVSREFFDAVVLQADRLHLAPASRPTALRGGMSARALRPHM